MPNLDTPATQPAPIRVGGRTIVPRVEAVGPALPARATYPQLDQDELQDLIEAFGDTFSDSSRTRLRVVCQGFAILGAGRVILVDTCLGGPKPNRPHPRGDFVSRWPSALIEAGIRPDHVDTVINTHLHHDHVGWNTTFEAGQLRPTFPRALYLTTTAEFVHATRGKPQDHITNSLLPLQSTKQFDTCEPDTRIDQEVRLIPAPGHTPGHVVVEIDSQGQRAVLAADLIHHPLQLRRPDVSAAMCTDPHQSAITRRRILRRYADTGTLFLPSHLPKGGYLRSAGDGWRLTERP
ncbi:MBL fold metallo-hydrolase [Streptomyces sp. NPDC001381]|uniref:MBL fold metallo-hydrolase n=1 Tax=Streptomyces sp. NPDC001381 TaxID=3364567 RepID=UPI0036A0E7A8